MIKHNNSNHNNKHRHKLVTIIVLALCLSIQFVRAAPDSDKIASLPGYPQAFNASVYAGFLKTSSDLRHLHYVFIQNYKGANNTLPVTVWMNGGPGCASKIGLLQQIAPYVLPLTSDYQTGQPLVSNPFSWLNLTNLLFIDGPAGVGYSINNDPDFVYSDKNTSKDHIDALTDFFTNKFPQYLSNPLYLAGESYAGKYIPDLAMEISIYNAYHSDKMMNLKGILLGNPAMNFKSGSLQDSQIQFMMSHHFIDPKIYPNWKGACHTDPQSASCQFFYIRYEELMKRIDFYNIYGSCLDGKAHLSQSTFMKKLAKKHSRLNMDNNWPWTWTQFSECFNDKPIDDYFTINAKTFNSNATAFSICNSTVYQKYLIGEGGSMSQLQLLIGSGQIKVYFFSGDWDDVIPFSDTVKNIQKMGLKQDGIQAPWKLGTKHIGFIRSYQNKNNVKFFIIKGAGHQSVAYKPEPGYRMLEMFLSQ